MSHKYNAKGISHHLLLPVIAILIVGGIGSYVMLRSSSAATKSCVQRTFSTSTNSSSVCVSYIIDLMKASGKASKAKSLSGTKFGASTKAAVQQFQSQWTSKPDGIVSANATTWSKLCSQGKSGAKTAWTKAGCNGSTSAKKGWTSLGSAAAGESLQGRLVFSVKACKIASSKSGYYKIRVSSTKRYTTAPQYPGSDTDARLDDSDGKFSIGVRKIQGNSGVFVNNVRIKNAASFKTKTFTTSKLVSANSKFYVYGWNELGGGTSHGQRTGYKTVSALLTCN